MMAEKPMESNWKPAPEGFRESGKLLFDLMKHLTTLSTGSIVLLVVFVEKLFPNPSFKWFIVVVLSSLILSTISSLLTMFVIVVGAKAGNDFKQKIGVGAFWAAAGFCLLGFIVLVAFAILNI